VAETPKTEKPKTAAERSRAELATRERAAVAVEIYDQIYQLSGTDREYIERLAQLVDAKMRAVSAHGATVDSLRVAVLAALNIADEMLTMQARHDELAESLNHATAKVHNAVQSRAGSLMGMLDEVLLERKAG
jgi:cell division protein ZapA